MEPTPFIPGYGFLSENAEFAEACAKAGIVFIGPPAAAIRKMGSKTVGATAWRSPPERRWFREPSRRVRDIEEARAIAGRIGLSGAAQSRRPAEAAKGMRRVDREQDLESALRDASSEALRAFRNDEVYLEKLVVEPRHIEIQVLGDHHGHMIHLGERECSIQRRHQKVIEECPSPVMLEHPELRERMGEAALNIARAAGYANAGTMEFLVDRDRNFYFLEMNTRLQVEHPVTELATGLDLVQWQLRIAAGERLTLRQDDVAWTGSAIECRDLRGRSRPSISCRRPGRSRILQQPSGPGIRLDSGVYQGWTVPLDYDPMLAKLAAWAPSRDAAIARMRARAGGIRGRRHSHQYRLVRRNSERSGFSSPAGFPPHLSNGFERVKRAAPDHRNGSRRGVGGGACRFRSPSRPSNGGKPQRMAGRWAAQEMMR